MERKAFKMFLLPGFKAEYKKRHDEIWPELVDALKECGFTNYTIFRRGLTAVGYLEAVPSKAVAFEKLSHYEVNAKWAKWFEDVIVNLTDGKGNLLELKEIWRLEE